MREVVKLFAIGNVALMHPVQTSFRILTWCCVVVLAVLSLLPDRELVRTGMPGKVEHFLAYAGSASIPVAGDARGLALDTIGLFWIYPGILEYVQHFSPGRHPSLADFEALALGAIFGRRVAALLVCRLWKMRTLKRLLI